MVRKLPVCYQRRFSSKTSYVPFFKNCTYVVLEENQIFFSKNTLKAMCKMAVTWLTMISRLVFAKPRRYFFCHNDIFEDLEENRHHGLSFRHHLYLYMASTRITTKIADALVTYIRVRKYSKFRSLRYWHDLKLYIIITEYLWKRHIRFI